MKRFACILFVGILLAAGSVSASRVVDIELSYVNGAAVARIQVDGPVRYMHQTEVPKDGKPYRVIVDLLAATHDLGAKEFGDLPKCPVVKVRTSQYAVEPEKIVRVVFDMTKSPLYRISEEGGAVLVTFTDNSVKPFAVWSCSQLQKQRTLAAAESVRVSKPEVTAGSSRSVTQKNKTINSDRLTSLGPPEKTVPKKVTEDLKGVDKPVVVAKRDKPVVQSEPKEKPQPSAKASQPSVRKVDMSDTTYDPEFDGDILALDQPPSVLKRAGAQQGLMSSAAKPAAADRKDGPKKALVKQPAATPKPVVAKATVKTPPAKVAAKPVASTKKVEQKPLAKTSATPVAPKKVVSKSSSKVESKAGSGQAALAKKLTVEKPSGPKQSKPANVTKPATQPTVASKDVKSADKGAAAVKTRKTSRFRRSPDKIKGTMVAEFPKRLVIQYRARLSRDPFESLLTESESYSGPVESRVPNVEGLQLVGVIESNGAPNSALLEDKQGFSYILKSGDKVKKGYVLRVESDRVYFQIFEYGWSRTVALSLNEY